MRIYVFPCGLVSYRSHKKLIKYGKKTLSWGKMALAQVEMRVVKKNGVY